MKPEQPSLGSVQLPHMLDCDGGRSPMTNHFGPRTTSSRLPPLAGWPSRPGLLLRSEIMVEQGETAPVMAATRPDLVAASPGEPVEDVLG